MVFLPVKGLIGAAGVTLLLDPLSIAALEEGHCAQSAPAPPLLDPPAQSEPPALATHPEGPPNSPPPPPFVLIGESEVGPKKL